MLKTNKQINFISETPMAHSTDLYTFELVFGESESKMKSMSVQYNMDEPKQNKKKRNETKISAK